MTYHHLLSNDQKFLQGGGSCENLKKERRDWGQGIGEEEKKSCKFFITPPEFDSCLHFEKKKWLWEGG